MKLFRIPVYAWPGVLRHKLARRFTAHRRPPPDLSDAELDFFCGGTQAVAARLRQPAFRFFAPEEFGPAPPAEACESILAGRVYLLGEAFDVGRPIHWRRDFRTGHEWASEHISRLTLVTTAGDVKVPWELSRFGHGLVLARGYAATGDSRCAREWAEQFHAWRADNPPEHGPNWGNAMEAALRAANWIAAYTFLRAGLVPDAGEALLKALIQHGRFIFDHLEDYWPPANHLLADLCGLIWIGLYLRPDPQTRGASPEPQRWLAYGLRELQRQVRRQVLPDGADYEASTAYHRFVADVLASTLRLCELNGLFVPPAMREAAARMEAVTAALRKPDGSLPLFGDEDGGSFPAPQPKETAGTSGGGWRSFPLGGWHVHRDGDEYLAIRAGGNGQAGWGGHAHNDALSFEYAIGPRTFLVDPGAYAYTADPAARDLFRSTAYHNTLRVDGQEISRIPPGELFRLEDDVRCTSVLGSLPAHWEGTPWWDGAHTGYGRLGIIHHRRFEKQPGGWLIRDTVSGRGSHQLEWFFHFAPGCPVQASGPRAWTGFAGPPNIALAADAAPAAVLMEGWVSPAYGRRDRAPVVCYTLEASLPATVEFSIGRL